MLTTLDFSQTEARITGVSGSPYADANASSLSTIYISPVLEGKIAFWTGSKIIQATLTEIAVSVASDTAGTMYDLYVYFDTSTQSIKYEKVAWANTGWNSVRAQAITKFKGCYVKASDYTRKLIGTYQISSTGITADSSSYRYIDNIYHLIPKTVYIFCSNYHNYASSTPREFIAASGQIARAYFIKSVPDIRVSNITLGGKCISANVNYYAMLKLGVYNINNQSAPVIYSNPVAENGNTVWQRFSENDGGLIMSGYTTIGYACFVAMEQAPNNSTIYPNDVSIMGTLLM